MGVAALFCQTLYRDDGKPLGVIVRFYEDAPTHAWVGISGIKYDGAHFFNARRLGACPTDQAARDAVEWARRNLETLVAAILGIHGHQRDFHAEHGQSPLGQ
jgi:hypothetical protein